jgi:hypothetical protein
VVVNIGAAAIVQYELVGLEGYTSLSALAKEAPGLAAFDVGVSGAIGGALNTGTLRGALIGAVTAEAFWGVGNLAANIGDQLAKANFIGKADAGAGAFDASIVLHAAVGCVSSAAGGGQCGSGALSAGLGQLTTGFAQSLTANPFLQAGIVGLGGGTGAALTGGQFGDGFFIAASGYVFNCLGHVCADGSTPSEGVNGTWSPFDFVGGIVGGFRALVAYGVEEFATGLAANSARGLASEARVLRDFG